MSARKLRVFLSGVAGTTSQNKDYKDAQSRIYPIQKGTYADRVYHSEAPLIIDIEQVLRHYPESQNLRFAYNFGMRDQIAHRLTYSGKVIGMFAFLSKKKGCYTTKDVENVRSLSSLLAIALNNILAYQELLLENIRNPSC